MDDLAPPRPRSFAFGPFVLVPEHQLLVHGNTPVRIGGRALNILTALVEQSGELVGKRELMARAWPDAIVDESNLKVNVAALRRALGDGGSHDARYIATVTGRGYQFVAAVTTAQAPGSSLPETTPAQPHNLPIGTARILGRAAVIATILRDFEASRLVTVVGAGGIGKTTVALAVAEQALGSFRDGVWLVDFARLKDAELAPHVIASALGVSADGPNAWAAVLEALRIRELLIVLDSCEHIIEAAASCASRILAEARGVKILVTSREPLMVRGERVRRLSGLEAPPSSPLLRAQEALAFPAVQLFVDRATDTLESFRLVDADAPVLAEICRRLDGLALAIELAATRVDMFGVAGLLKQVEDRVHLLIGRRAGPERHRTLVATLDWSYDLLPPNEAALLRAVSVFAGVFDIEAASAVSGVNPTDASNLLAQLASKSLLVLDLGPDDAAYRLLETTRAYCFQGLLDGGEAALIRSRHAEHVCQVLERGAREWPQRSTTEWEGAYGRVLDDLRAALAWAADDSSRRAIRIRLAVAGILLWNHFSLLEECRTHVSTALEEIEAAGLTGTAFEMHLQAWLGASSMFTRGLSSIVTEATQRALTLAVELGDVDTHLRCLRTIGLFQHITGEHTSGLATFEKFAALGARRAASNRDGEVHLSISEYFLGRLPSARQRLARLRESSASDAPKRQTYRYQSDITCVIGCVSTQVEWLTGSPDASALTGEATVAYALGTKHHLTLNEALAAACPVAYWSGRYESCVRAIAMLDELARRHGISTRRPIAMFLHAALTVDAGLAEAIDGMERAIAAFRRVKLMARVPYYLSVLAETQGRAGDLDAADATIDQALALVQTQSEGWCHPEVLRVKASIAAARGQVEEAEALYLESIALARQTGALSWRLRAATGLTALSLAGPRAERAQALLRSTYDEFTEGFETPDLVAASKLLG
jgi:predicted ATPase/DNA-binding winged helix-turn-helix (wHTH) protein